MRLRAALLGLLLASGTAQAKVLWRGDFETGDIGQWNEKLNADKTSPPRVTVVADPVREGRRAARVEVRNGDLWPNGLNRVELGHHPDVTTFAGSERYYAFSVFVPRDGAWDAREKQIGYWEADVIWQQVMAFVVHGQDVRFVTRLPADHVRWDGAGKLTRGRWHDFILHVKWSTDPRDGFVELWFDGERVLGKTAVATMRAGPRGQPMPNFLHLGLFRGPPPPAPLAEVMYLDAAAEATALADLPCQPRP